MAIGIQLYTVRQMLQAHPAATLRKLHAIGFRLVETAGLAGRTATQFHALLVATGLACPSAHLDFNRGDLGATYATSSMLVGSLDRADPNAPLRLDDFQQLAHRMNQIGEAAREAGLQYAYHNHDIEFVRLPDGSCGYDLLLRETEPDLVKFEADCGWMVVAGADPVYYFQAHPHRFCMMHVKDFEPVKHPVTVLSGPDRPTGAQLGHGYIQYGSIFAAAKAAGIRYAFAEQEAPYLPTELAAAQVDYAYMASLARSG